MLRAEEALSVLMVAGHYLRNVLACTSRCLMG